MIKLKKDNQGYTLLELMVSISIMLVLLMYFLLNFRGLENKMSLKNQAEELMAILKQAQIYTLVGQTFDDQRYNYGVHLSECDAGSCEYILFKDLEETGDKIYQVEEKIETQIAGEQIKIIDGALKVDENTVNNLDIVFEVPLAKVWINGVESQAEVEIDLYHARLNGVEKIKLNAATGKIEIIED